MKGRKPGRDNVVPLKTGRGVEGHRAAAVQRAADLRPADLPSELRPIWDRLAPVACDPLRRKRLDDDTVAAFVLLCRAEWRFLDLERRLQADGETYAVQTRNGLQMKSRPEVAQRNVAWSQYLTLIREFGMTPMAERSLAAGGKPQGVLDFGDPD